MIDSFYLSPFSDPYINLAIENELLINLKPDSRVLLLYINGPSVVMGRFQNPWLEANLEYLKQEGIHLVRRQSGGGCVYHDEGNLNFSFIESNRELGKKANNEYIIKILQKLDIKAFIGDRNNLWVMSSEGERKISGSAFKQKRDRSFHHGTLLVDTDIEKLKRALKPKDYQITSKSIDSVRSKSMNLKSLNANLTMKKLIDSFCDKFETLTINKTIEVEAARLRSWEWVMGETPYFECRLSQGVIKSRKGLLIETDIESLKNQIGMKLEDISGIYFDSVY